MIESFKIIKIKGESRERVEDIVPVEIALTIMINNQELVTLLCSPGDPEDLITGFLFTSGLIKKAEDIKKIAVNREQWIGDIELVDKTIAENAVFKRLYTSGCGRGTLYYSASEFLSRTEIVSELKIEAGKINSLMLDFQKRSESYLKTGGVHSAALADDKGILIFKEDIGRHNALDKVIGCALKEGHTFQNRILITSGRMSSEVIFKAQKCRIPAVISRSAPTNQGIKLARDMGITLIGFARGSRMNVYSAEGTVR